MMLKGLGFAEVNGRGTSATESAAGTRSLQERAGRASCRYGGCCAVRHQSCTKSSRLDNPIGLSVVTASDGMCDMAQERRSAFIYKIILHRVKLLPSCQGCNMPILSMHQLGLLWQIAGRRMSAMSLSDLQHNTLCTGHL